MLKNKDLLHGFGHGGPVQFQEGAVRDKRFQPARRVGGRLFGRLQMGKLRREARRLTFIIRPVTEVVLTAEQALPIVLINRLPEAVEAVQAGLQRPLPIVDSPWFGLWQGLCGQQTQVPGGGEQPVQIASRSCSKSRWAISWRVQIEEPYRL